MDENCVDVLFSDLDGTLVHYPKEFLDYADIISEDDGSNKATIKYKLTGEERECVALTSMTGGKAYISVRTNELIQQLRKMGVIFVIITGARSSTYISRQPFLPEADFEFFENGGRMLEKGILNAAWTDQFADQVGEIYDRVTLLPELPPPSERDGTLWSLYKLMKTDSWTVDARDYTVNFRVDVMKSEGKTLADLKTISDRECEKRNLSTSFNLGKADFYPAGSGKGSAAKCVLNKLGISAENAVAIFDDDNDLELGALCGRAFLPGVTHPTVLEAIRMQPSWTLTAQRGFLGTEFALESIIQLRLRALNSRRELAVGS